MKKPDFKYCLILTLAFILNAGCIHDYPHDGGIDPTMVEIGVELTIDLSFEQFAASAIFDTRASREASHRIVIEILRHDDVVGREEVLLTDQDLLTGVVTHPLSFRLHALDYRIMVWYDRSDETGSYSYETSDLSLVKQLSFLLNWKEHHICGYASTHIDLSSYRNKWGAKVMKRMELNHAGCRFELITTDFQDFIDNQRPALLQGDKYTLTVSVTDGAGEGFNLQKESLLRPDRPLEATDELRLPFIESDMLTIADGFLFCEVEGDVTMKLTVHNSARMIVAQTNEFRFPVKRGSLTRVTGSFLSNFFKGTVTIDNIWAGEIEIEI